MKIDFHVAEAEAAPQVFVGELLKMALFFLFFFKKGNPAQRQLVAMVTLTVTLQKHTQKDRVWKMSDFDIPSGEHPQS